MFISPSQKKGYRDAQIGWMWVDDESDEKVNKRSALYLIIYAPRRGLLEVLLKISSLEKKSNFSNMFFRCGDVNKVFELPLSMSERTPRLSIQVILCCH